uniref:Venom protein n=1 Tax=Ampulex compressa TaxID=860918 RepID=A0A1W6EW96_AMPCP|nr:venom protein [Ampulex compressa]
MVISAVLKPVEFLTLRIDRPFYYSIRNRDHNVVFFQGQVYLPKK